MKVSTAKEKGITELTCSKTGRTLPLSEFRIHARGYYLSYCKDWERAEAKRRRKTQTASNEVTIITPKGRTYTGSTKPIVGGRKAESPHTDKILYFTSKMSRDQVRTAFRTYTGVPMTGIKAGRC